MRYNAEEMSIGLHASMLSRSFETDPPSSAGLLSVDLLYSTPLYQIRLYTLASGETLPLPPNSDDSTFWPLKGALSVFDLRNEREIGVLQPGQAYHRQMPSPADAATGDLQADSLHNSAAAPAFCLEILRGDFTPSALRLQGHNPPEKRPWGSFTVLRDDPCYKLKQLMVLSGNRLSLQRHQRRKEIWMVLAGHPCITLDEQTLNLEPGDTIHIPLGSWHRIANPLSTDKEQIAETVEIVELQLGDYFGEDDIERREDDYGRV